MFHPIKNKPTEGAVFYHFFGIVFSITLRFFKLALLNVAKLSMNYLAFQMRDSVL